MKHSLAFAVGITSVLTLGSLAACSTETPATTATRLTSFWVAPDGHDSARGTKQAPFRTLDRARDAVRTATARSRGDVLVNLRGGTYRLDHTFTLGPQDSGRGGHDVIYRAAPGEHPVISGARSVPGASWSVYDATVDIWRAPVGHVRTRQLYVNGQRATVAQTTPYPAGVLPHWSTGADSGIQYKLTDLNPAAWRDPSTWTNPSAVRAVITTQWRMMSVPVQSITPPVSPAGTGLISMQQPAWNNANVFRDAKTNAPGVWSFWQVTRFENALQFLDTAGEWYLDDATSFLYYRPRPGEVMSRADVELPRLETLVEGQGRIAAPVTNLRFEGLTFTGATWWGPSTGDGYVSDQSGFRLTGTGHPANTIGHDRHDTPTPGNVQFRYARRVTFTGNIFEHLGAVGLALGTGSQSNRIEGNLFTDTSSAALQLGGISPVDAHPKQPTQVTRDNVITDNLVEHVATEYVDAAGIYAGFTRHTTITHNTIVDVPWTGIAMGWGWGLLDPGSFPGLPGAKSGQWGSYRTLTPNRDSVVRENRIDRFLNSLWDGGAIYTTGQQGPSFAHGLRIEGNVATNKRPAGGGNTFYTDGGSRFITVQDNISLNNPVGFVDFGPPPPAGDPLPYSAALSVANTQHYGSDLGGCVTYGDIRYVGNHWLQDPFQQDVAGYSAAYRALLGFAPYSKQGFFNVCPYTALGVSYPAHLTYRGNQVIDSGAIDPRLMGRAGVQRRPATIPADRWDPPRTNS